MNTSYLMASKVKQFNDELKDFNTVGYCQVRGTDSLLESQSANLDSIDILGDDITAHFSYVKHERELPQKLSFTITDKDLSTKFTALRLDDGKAIDEFISDLWDGFKEDLTYGLNNEFKQEVKIKDNIKKINHELAENIMKGIQQDKDDIMLGRLEYEDGYINVVFKELENLDEINYDSTKDKEIMDVLKLDLDEAMVKDAAELLNNYTLNVLYDKKDIEKSFERSQEYER